MAGGVIFASIFFWLFLMAALTSSISLLEVVAAYFIDQRGWSRSKAVWVLGGSIFVLGIPSALAAGPWANVTIASLLGGAPGEGALGSVRFFQLNWFDLVGHIVSDYMLPVGGFFVCLFVGWAWHRSVIEQEVRLGNPAFTVFTLWLNLLRYVGPLVIGEVLLLGILAEFPPEYFPRIAATVDTLHVWFTGLDILVALVVVVVSTMFNSDHTGEQAA